MQTKQTDLQRLLTGTKTFLIPQFQRHYKWKRPQWTQIFADVVDQYQNPDVRAGTLVNDEGHFIGSMVFHPAPGPVSTVARYWVIDGQQRLTTLMVLIAALRDVRVELDPDWDPGMYNDQYLANKYHPDNPHKLVLGLNDDPDFQSTVYRSEPTGQIGECYKWFCKSIAELDAHEPFDFDRFEAALLLRLLVVEITTSEQDNINQIFNTINYAGLRLTAVDLIRNHAFMQFDSGSASPVYTNHWRPLEQALETERGLTDYLWAQLVRFDRNATKRDLYRPFQERLKSISRAEDWTASEATAFELKRLHSESKIYRAIQEPSLNPSQQWSSQLCGALVDLVAWGSQTYVPVALELLADRAARFSEGQHDGEYALALRHLLSYLVRRGLAGIPTNNLNRILSAVPSEIRGEEEIWVALTRELQTGAKYWPSDLELRQRVPSVALYRTLGPGQVKFILAELNDHLNPRETVVRESLTVEHIAPQALSAEWLEQYRSVGVDAEDVRTRVHVLGNLTLTGINQQLGRMLPSEKSALLQESNLPLNRVTPVPEVWRPSEIDERTNSLIELALEVWPRPANTSPNSETDNELLLLPTEFTIENLLEAIPADSAVAVDTIAEFLAAPRQKIENELERLNYPILRLVFTEGGAQDLVGGVRTLTGEEAATLTPLDGSELADLVQSIGTDNNRSAEED